MHVIREHGGRGGSSEVLWRESKCREEPNLTGVAWVSEARRIWHLNDKGLWRVVVVAVAGSGQRVFGVADADVTSSGGLTVNGWVVGNASAECEVEEIA